MISDTLSDAVKAIDEYLTNPVFSEVYEGETRISVTRVKAEMERLRIELDKPSAAPHMKCYEELRKEAAERYADNSDNDIEIPDDAYVSISDEPFPDGAFVEARVWVPL